jgi:superfamily I DNA and/or RNA helicase
MKNDNTMDDGQQHQVEDDQLTDSSLLESILFVMTQEQREHFLKSSSSNGIIYANKSPYFDYPLSVLLTRKVCNQLTELIKDENQDIADFTSQNQLDTHPFIDGLKADLEAGIRLSKARWYEDENGKNNVSMYVQSNLFVMKCILHIEADDKVLFKAIYLEGSTYSKKSGTKTEEFDVYETPESDEPIDIDVLDVNETIKNDSVSINTNVKEFVPHIKTSWHVYPSYSEDMMYLDFEVIKKIIWKIDTNRLLSRFYRWTRKYFKELADVVHLSQLSVQYRYRLEGERETPDGRCCWLRVDRSQEEELTQIKLAYVYTEENGTDDTTGSRHNNIAQLLKRRRRKPCVLERQGYERDCHLFNVLEGEEIPSEGFLVDVGFESQIKKQLEAMRYLESPKNIVHLIKLATLLGSIETSKFEAFSWKNGKIDLFDKALTKHQREAVLKALDTPDICLIQGPPGTGKTRVISEIVQQASRRGWKTLLAAPTHVAVDNVLERVGYKDNISPIRCVNKDKIDALPQNIQQFTYEQRKNSLIVHSQDKVKEDIDRLNKNRKRLEETFEGLQRVHSLFEDTARLLEKERSLKNQLSAVEKNVQKDFAEELQNRDRAKQEKDRLLCNAKKQLATAEEALQILEARIEQFQSGLYTSIDKTRFKLAQSDVDKIQGKALNDIKGQFNNVKKRAYSMQGKLRQTKEQFTNTKAILSQLDKGTIPEDVQKAIKRAVVSVTTKHDHSIAARLQELEKARNKLCEMKETTDGLRQLVEKIRRKRNKLAKERNKPWWSKTFSPIWWQSKFINYENQQTKYTSQRQYILALLPAIELKIETAKLSFEKSKTTKIDALEKTEKSEFVKQHELYRSRYNLLPQELDSIEIELQKEDSRLAMLGEEVEDAQNSFERASDIALAAVKKQIRQELASELTNSRSSIIRYKAEVESAGLLALESQSDFEKLHDQITKIVKQRKKQHESNIDKVKIQIAANNDQFAFLKEQATLLMEEKAPESPQAVRDALKKLTVQIERNKQLTVFSENWLDCLHRNSEQLSKRLAKYINLVCATTIGIASDEYFGDGKPLEQKQFDLLVIDEAGKVTEPRFLVAATRAKKWVIVGDHKQLPPYYDRKLNNIFAEVNELRNQNDLSQLDPSVLRISYFENLWNQLFASETEPEKADARFVTLDVQRRMHPDLALFISDMFYQNKYKSPEGPKFIKEKTLDLSRFKYPVTFIEVSPPKGGKQLETNLRLESIQGNFELSSKTGYANLTEAKQIIEVLHSLLSEESIFDEQKKLKRKNDSAATIGIIAFYAGQVELIRELITTNDFLEAEEQSSEGQFLCKGKIRVAVNTVDSFQGKECSVIILSFTRSNPYRNIGFVDDANRLNVAMSRAKKKLILLGDKETFINRASARDNAISGDDTSSIRAERLFFEKLVQYIEGCGEIKKAFHVWRTENETA